MKHKLVRHTHEGRHHGYYNVVQSVVQNQMRGGLDAVGLR